MTMFQRSAGALRRSVTVAAAASLMVPFGVPSVLRGQTCTSPSQASLARVGPEFAVRLAGEWRMVLVAQSGDSTLVSSEGVLRLLVTPDTLARSPNPQLILPLYGSTTIDLNSFGPLAVAHSPADTSLSQPGVQVSQNLIDSTLAIWLGNSWTRGGMATDAGVILSVSSASPQALTGKWTEAGRRRPSTAGYFCAFRQESM